MSTFVKIKERRSGKKELLKAFENFKPITSEEVYSGGGSTCGNIMESIEGKYSWDGEKSGYKGGVLKGKPFYKLVSAPYLLARLVAAHLPVEVESKENAYKTTWQVNLRHKPTRHVVCFYDYKGASSIGSDVYGKDAPKEFVSDLQKLAKALIDDQFPHPYDGCVVGEIA